MRTLMRGFSKLFGCDVGIGGENLRQRVGEFVLAGVGLLAESLNLLEFFAPQFVDFVVECQGVLAERGMNE